MRWHVLGWCSLHSTMWPAHDIRMCCLLFKIIHSYFLSTFFRFSFTIVCCWHFCSFCFSLLLYIFLGLYFAVFQHFFFLTDTRKFVCCYRQYKYSIELHFRLVCMCKTERHSSLRTNWSLWYTKRCQIYIKRELIWLLSNSMSIWSEDGMTWVCWLVWTSLATCRPYKIRQYM